MSYQELNYLSQTFGVNLTARDKRANVDIKIKDV